MDDKVEDLSHGMLHDPSAANADVQPRKYGGKELDRQNGLDLYDSQVRWYDPVLGRTTTMDPKAESYYDISPYVWCASNPVRNVDRDGCDTLSINQKGYINVKSVTDDDFDILVSEDGQSITVPKSFYQSKQIETVTYDNEKYECDLYSVDDISMSELIFRFVILNSDVEWSRLTYEDGDIGMGNSHRRKEDMSGKPLDKSRREKRSMIKYYDHSHPYTSHPSDSDKKNSNNLKTYSQSMESRLYIKVGSMEGYKIRLVDFDQNYDNSKPIEYKEDVKVIFKKRK